MNDVNLNYISSILIDPHKGRQGTTKIKTWTISIVTCILFLGSAHAAAIAYRYYQAKPAEPNETLQKIKSIFSQMSNPPALPSVQISSSYVLNDIKKLFTAKQNVKAADQPHVTEKDRQLLEMVEWVRPLRYHVDQTISIQEKANILMGEIVQELAKRKLTFGELVTYTQNNNITDIPTLNQVIALHQNMMSVAETVIENLDDFTVEDMNTHLVNLRKYFADQKLSLRFIVNNVDVQKKLFANAQLRNTILLYIRANLQYQHMDVRIFERLHKQIKDYLSVQLKLAEQAIRLYYQAIPARLYYQAIPALVDTEKANIEMGVIVEMLAAQGLTLSEFSAHVRQNGFDGNVPIICHQVDALHQNMMRAADAICGDLKKYSNSKIIAQFFRSTGLSLRFLVNNPEVQARLFAHEVLRNAILEYVKANLQAKIKVDTMQKIERQINEWSDKHAQIAARKQEAEIAQEAAEEEALKNIKNLNNAEFQAESDKAGVGLMAEFGIDVDLIEIENREQFRKKYKELSLKFHTDKGGDEEVWKRLCRLKELYDQGVLKHYIEQHKLKRAAYLSRH